MSLLLALSSSGGPAASARLWMFKSTAAVALALLAVDELAPVQAATLHDYRHIAVTVDGMTAHPINRVVLVQGEDAIVHVDHARKFQPFRQYPVAAPPPTVGAPWYLWDRRQLRIDDEPVPTAKPVTVWPFIALQYERVTTTYTIDLPDIGDPEWTREDIRYPKVDFQFFRRQQVTAQAGQPWYLWKPRQTEIEPEADFQRFNHAKYVRQIVAQTQPGQPFFSWKRTLAAPEVETYTIPPVSLFVLTRVTIETITPPSSGVDDYIARARRRGRR